MCDDIKNSEQILPQDVKVSFDDVVAFWMTLFPELKNNLDFEKILKNSSELTLHQLEQEYYTKYNNKLDTLFEALSKREYKDSLIDEILNQYRSACKWVYFFRPVVGYYTYN
ncbi:MAG TPA: hypothetical protein VHP38_13810, partial [Ruminiclostridium sp.]|nr:hypothetical protein [Ruminiclostridium sp.]